MLELPIKIKYYQKGELVGSVIDNLKCDTFDKTKINSHFIIEKFDLKLKGLNPTKEIIALPSFISSQFIFRNEVVHGDIFYDKEHDIFYLCVFKKGIDVYEGVILKGFEKVVFIPIHSKLNDHNLFHQSITFENFNKQLTSLSNHYYFVGNLFIHSNVVQNMEIISCNSLNCESITSNNLISDLCSSFVIKEHGDLWIVYFSEESSDYMQEQISNMDVFDMKKLDFQIRLCIPYDYLEEKKYAIVESNTLIQVHLKKLTLNGIPFFLEESYTQFLYTVDTVKAETCLLFKNGTTQPSFIFEGDLNNQEIFEPFYCLEQNRTKQEKKLDKKSKYEKLFLKFIKNM